jgi:hypothetical protein
MFQNLNDFFLCKKSNLKQTLGLPIICLSKIMPFTHPKDVKVNYAFKCHKGHHDVQQALKLLTKWQTFFWMPITAR